MDVFASSECFEQTWILRDARQDVQFDLRVVVNLIQAGLGEVTPHITEEIPGRRGSAESKQDIADQLCKMLFDRCERRS